MAARHEGFLQWIHVGQRRRLTILLEEGTVAWRAQRKVQLSFWDQRISLGGGVSTPDLGLRWCLYLISNSYCACNVCGTAWSHFYTLRCLIFATALPLSLFYIFGSRGMKRLVDFLKPTQLRAIQNWITIQAFVSSSLRSYLLAVTRRERKMARSAELYLTQHGTVHPCLPLCSCWIHMSSQLRTASTIFLWIPHSSRLPALPRQWGATCPSVVGPELLTLIIVSGSR